MALFLCFMGCGAPERTATHNPDRPFLVVLGVAQDAGYPQAGQSREWELVQSGKARKEQVVALGLIDPVSNERWLFEATPDFSKQLQMMDERSTTPNYPYDGIFLTHGHIGHYTGLIHLGREAMGAKGVPVYMMPRMNDYLATNGPWSQLITLDNIRPVRLENEKPVKLNERISVMPFIVPHRDEFTETVGYQIEANGKKAVFIPDIDKWERWEKSIIAMIEFVDIAFLDASFFKNGEIPGRDMSEIPHPFVEESMALFQSLPPKSKAKVHFIHFNHTNPLIFEDSNEYQQVYRKGFRVAKEGQIFIF